MHFNWSEREYDGLGCLNAVPAEYDGIPPVDSLLLGTAPERMEPSLLAIAGALAFGAYTEDAITLDLPIAPLVADAITEFFGRRRVQPPTVDYRPRRLTEGQGSMVVSRYQGQLPEASGCASKLGEFHVVLAESFEAPRGYANGNLLILPTNGTLISPYSTSDPRSVYPELAAVVLLAGELGTRKVDWRTGNYQADDNHLVRARRLLRSANRELVWS